MDNTIEIKLERVNKNKDVNIINNKKVKSKKKFYKEKKNDKVEKQD